MDCGRGGGPGGQKSARDANTPSVTQLPHEMSSDMTLGRASSAWKQRWPWPALGLGIRNEEFGVYINAQVAHPTAPFPLARSHSVTKTHSLRVECAPRRTRAHAQECTPTNPRTKQHED